MQMVIVMVVLCGFGLAAAQCVVGTDDTRQGGSEADTSASHQHHQHHQHSSGNATDQEHQSHQTHGSDQNGVTSRDNVDDVMVSDKAGKDHRDHEGHHLVEGEPANPEPEPSSHDSQHVHGAEADHSAHQMHASGHEHHDLESDSATQEDGESHDHGVASSAHAHWMKMWFHGGWEEVILFDFWRINTLAGLLLSCLGVFVMACVYEGLKWFRLHLQRAGLFDSIQPPTNRAPSAGAGFRPLLRENGTATGGAVAEQAPSSGHAVPVDTTGAMADGRGESYTAAVAVVTTTTSDTRTVTNRFASTASSLFGAGHLVQTLLYAVQVLVAYWLMLIVMTYNSYLTAAVVLGATFGHWLFASMDCIGASPVMVDSFVADVCH